MMQKKVDGGHKFCHIFNSPYLTKYHLISTVYLLPNHGGI